MKRDHTLKVEKRVEAIQINELDSCSFFTPQNDSLVAVSLCSYCKYGEFNEKEINGFCLYRIEAKRTNIYED